MPLFLYSTRMSNVCFTVIVTGLLCAPWDLDSARCCLKTRIRKALQVSDLGVVGTV